jgi:Uma2 family endonuclease
VNRPRSPSKILSTRRGNIERTEKLDDYARAGIAEYWIVDPFERAFEVYHLEESKYKLSAVEAEEIDSCAMPGLSIGLRALFDLN